MYDFNDLRWAFAAGVAFSAVLIFLVVMFFALYDLLTGETNP
jgi:hypothetical protein